MRAFFAMICGTIFGLGLAVSGMINPAKVLAFLDIFGAWDPSLLLVMVSALAVTILAYRFVLRMPTAVAGEEFHLPHKTDLDRSLIIGAVLFGAGWGLVGFCPGPAIASLAYGRWETAVFIVAMVLGMGFGRRLNP